MIVLGLDTALSACSAAIVDSATGESLASRLVRLDVGHAELLPGMVRDVVHTAGLGFAGIDRIAVTIGPGTFTGVRIGLAFARGLGLALGRSVVGVSTLQALAANVKDNYKRLPIAVAIDARRSVYLQIFSPDLSAFTEPKALVSDCAASELPEEPVIAAGSGARFLQVAGRADSVQLSSGPALPDATVVALLGASITPGPPPSPMYLRPPVAGAPPERPFPRPSSCVRVETVGSVHAGVLAALHAECFDESWDGEGFASLMAMPGSTSFLALVATHEPAGFMLVRQADDQGEILTIGTRPALRRRGIAIAMLDHAITRLGRSGVRKLFIEVAASNAAARALYAGTGFKVRGERPAYYARPGGSREDAIVMSRVLKR